MGRAKEQYLSKFLANNAKLYLHLSRTTQI
jgi:hypothetical protein